MSHSFNGDRVIRWLGSAALAALLFELVETLALSGEEHWLGTVSGGPKSVLLGMTVYWSVLLAASSIPVFLINAALERKVPVPGSSSLTFLAALGLWEWVAYFSEVISVLINLSVALLLVGAMCQSYVESKRHSFGPSHWKFVSAVAMVSGIWAAYELSDLLFASPLRPSLVPGLAAAWTCLVFIAGVGALWFGGKKYPRRRTARLVALGLLSLSLPVLAWGTNTYRGLLEPRDGTRFILVTADTLRADYISAYGGRVSTPHMKALGEKGTRFADSYSLAPWTVPSLSGLFASKFAPGASGGVTNDEWREQSLYRYPQLAAYWTEGDGRTFVGRLTDQGIPTGAYNGNPEMKFQEWLMDGFGHVAHVAPRDYERRGFLHNQPVAHGAVHRIFPSLAPLGLIDSTRHLTEYATAFLRRYRHGPFFLWVHFMDPHIPYNPPKRYRTESVPWEYFPPRYTDVGPFVAGLGPEEKAHVRALYEGEIRRVDDALGCIQRVLVELGLDEDTFLCFTSDHGEEFWDHGEYGHGHSLYDEQLSVPLLIAGPGVRSQVIEEPASAIDLLPTVSEFFGEAPDLAWRGQSLVPVLTRGGGSVERPRFAGATYRFRIKTEPYQMVEWKGHKLIRALTTGRVELFNLIDDPGEKRDLAWKDDETVEEFLSLLNDWKKSFPSEISMFGLAASTQEEREEAQEALRALGYIE